VALSFLISIAAVFIKKKALLFILFFVKVIVYSVMGLLVIDGYPLVVGILFS
jgi:hypothetical protein